MIGVGPPLWEMDRAHAVEHVLPHGDDYSHAETLGVQCDCWPRVKSVYDGRQTTVRVEHCGPEERP